MNEILIVFASATTATRAKKQLNSIGVKAKVIQTPKILSVNGCSYSIITVYDGLYEIKRIASKMDVKIKGVFEITDNKYYPVYE